MKRKSNKQRNGEKKPIAPILKEMKINAVEVYPISRYTVVKAGASLTGLSYNMEFKTSANRSDGVVLVTRIG